MKASRKLLTGLTTLALTLGVTVSAFAAETKISFDDQTAGAAKVSGTATYVDGKVGKALQFNGTDTYLEVPTSVLTDNFTFAAWVKYDELLGWSRVFDFGSTSGEKGRFWVGYSANQSKFFLEMGGNGDATFATIPQNDAPVAGEWVHIAVTAKTNGNGGTDFVMYLNGVAQTATATSGSTLTKVEPAGMYIGKSNWPDPLFKGAMDEIVISDKAMSADEINALMNNTAAAAAATTETAVEATSDNPKTGDVSLIPYVALMAMGGTGTFFASRKRK